MYICLCNALTEKDIKELTVEEYLQIKQCGICQEEAMKLLKED